MKYVLPLPHTLPSLPSSIKNNALGTPKVAEREDQGHRIKMHTLHFSTKKLLFCSSYRNDSMLHLFTCILCPRREYPIMESYGS